MVDHLHPTSDPRGFEADMQIPTISIFFGNPTLQKPTWASGEVFHADFWPQTAKHGAPHVVSPRGSLYRWRKSSLSTASSIHVTSGTGGDYVSVLFRVCQQAVASVDRLVPRQPAYPPKVALVPHPPACAPPKVSPSHDTLKQPPTSSKFL